MQIQWTCKGRKLAYVVLSFSRSYVCVCMLCQPMCVAAILRELTVAVCLPPQQEVDLAHC